MKGHAPDWQIRCTNCDRTREADTAGVVRLGGGSIGKTTVGWCSGCGAFRLLAIEKKATATAS